MADASQDKLREFYDLEEWQRNCVIWPDFLEWGDAHDIEIEKENGTGGLGIVTVVLTVRGHPFHFFNIKCLARGYMSSN